MNVLTIDFDIIMAPSINLYNNMVPKEDWDDLERNPQINLSFADYQIYQKLTILLSQLITSLNFSQIHFIQDHEQVNQVIGTEPIETLVNIDHHHDVSYADEIEKLNCGNWVYYLKQNNSLQNYIWIHNTNSTFIPNDKSFAAIIDESYNFDDYNLDNLTKQNFDKLIICLSPPWVPPRQRALFYLWMDLFNNYYHTHFDFVRRPAV